MERHIKALFTRRGCKRSELVFYPSEGKAGEIGLDCGAQDVVLWWGEVTPVPLAEVQRMDHRVGGEQPDEGAHTLLPLEAWHAVEHDNAHVGHRFVARQPV